MGAQDKAKSSVMRLDKLFSLCGILSRSDTSRAVRAGDITVNGATARSADMKINADTDTVMYRGERVAWQRYTYIMLNKPKGYVSATEDGDLTVLDLLSLELRRIRPGLFPCGRLDKNTTGLMILTNDGELSHKLLAPKSHVDKSYYFEVKFPLSESDIMSLEGGVDIGGHVTAPAKITLNGESGKQGIITIHEGRYHQIKLMMEAVHNQITELSRISFGKINLPKDLNVGEYRPLTDEETDALRSSVK